jgi:YfiH family protein
MIRPPGFAGAAFGTVHTGDLRADEARRLQVSGELGLSSEWAFVTQVHSANVLTADKPGNLGEADAIITSQTGLPIAVATADCVPIILEASQAVAVVHAGWRGAAAGVVTETLATMERLGYPAVRAAIGPAIGPCCYEVGTEVVDRFPGFVATTTWGTPSVDIPRFVAGQLSNLEVWQSDKCTFTSETLHSWRRNRTKQRQVAVAWLPKT